MQRSSRSLDVVFQHLRTFIGTVFIFHGFCPNSSCDTTDNGIFRIHSVGEKERKIRCKCIDVHSAGKVIFHIRKTVGKRKCELRNRVCARFGKSREKKQVVTNLSGENLGSDNAYRGAGGRVVPVTLRNWYLESWFGEDRMKLLGYTAALACVLMELSLSLGGAFHV